MSHSTPRRIRTIGITAVLALAAAGLVSAPARAADPPPALDLAKAIARVSAQVTGAAYVTKPPSQSAYLGTDATSGRLTFPKHGSTFAVLQTGPGNLGGAASRGPYNFDVTVLRVDVKAPAGTVCLAGVDVRILSNAPVSADTRTMDRFVVEIDQTTWRQDGTEYGSPFVAPKNIAIDAFGSPLSAGVETGTARLTAWRAEGSDYPRSTRTMTVRTPITPGAHSIYFSLVDRGVATGDTTVFIDDLRFASAGPCPTGVVPAPATVRSVPAVTFSDGGSPTGTVTIPSHTGMRFVPVGAPAYPAVLSAGPYDGPGSGTLTVEAQPTGDSILQGASRWSNVYGHYDGALPTKSNPKPPTFTPAPVGGTVTIPTDTHVSYRINGQTAAAGNHTVFGEVVVHAVSSTRVLDGVTGWSNEFSGPAQVAPTPPILVVAKPKITGTAKVGKKLRASTGVWNPPSVAVTYRWLRGGKPISGATKATYTLKVADAGKKISVRTRATKAGFLAAQSTSAAKTVAKIKPKLVANLVRSKVAARQKGKVSLTVTVKGVKKPTGKVRVYVAGKTKTVSLKTKHKGTITVSLPKLTKGTYKIAVKYLGAARIKATAKVKVGTLRVT